METIGTDVNQIEITSLSHIKGQDKVVDVLKVNLEAYFNARSNGKGTAFGPALFVGPSGSGKSLVAKALHCELANLKIVEVNSEMLNASEMMSILIAADDNTTIFLDESQSLDSKVQHILLTALSEKKLYTSQKRKNGSYSIPLANFTLLLASTHEYQIQDALRNRMRIYCRFNYYSEEVLISIIKQRAACLKWKIEDENILKIIAERSKQTPRIALNRNLQMAYNVSSAKGKNIISIDDVIESFHLLEIDELGLDTLERAYLKELSKHNSLKLNILSSKLGLPIPTISNVIEPYLLRIELIEKSSSDRIITEKGKEHILNTNF